MLSIRAYCPDDCEKLAELFYQTVHTVNARDYTKEQQIVRNGVSLTNYVMEKINKKV